MDREQFDALARRLGAAVTRRGALAALLTGLAASALPGIDRPDTAAAARRSRGKGKDRRRDGRGQDRSKKRDKRRKPAPKQRAAAEATRCCSTGNCTPGKGKNLSKCCYQNQDLTNKNFSGSNLGEANFSGATLTGANVQAANLNKACFVDADLRGMRANASTHLAGSVYCRTQTDSGVNNAGCNLGTPCCPTCDAQHPCGSGEVCCDGRCRECCGNGDCGDDEVCCANLCVAGECCQTADCPNEVCQRRSCVDYDCAYTPVFAAPGPRCQTICCRNESGEPVCCPDGATTCDDRGLCCTPQPDDRTCGVGTADPKCGEVANNCGRQVDCGPCADKTCQVGSCGEQGACIYEAVFGGPGTNCQTVCCEDASGEPVCCAAGVTTCQASGICSCLRDNDCGANERCCAGTCIARSRCCEGTNPEGCTGELHCCALDGTGVCRECCAAAQCPDETCQTKSCGANNTCQYTPVFGDDGPGCATICCEHANEQPVCCPNGTTVCTASRRCRCEGAADCAANQLCCNGTCIANTRCCNNDPSTCPAPTGVCQERACANGDCQPRGVTGGTCPLPNGGGTGECSQGACICPSPRVTCNNVCCAAGVPGCKADGTCGATCDVCPSGCPFTTLAAAVAGTAAGGTIRICPGTYATNNVSIGENLTIVGAGSGSDPAVDTILSGGNTSGVLSILQATVTIRDLTVTGGKGANRCGGIEVLLEATLNLERVDVVGNTSDVTGTGPNSGGGLIVFAGSTANIKASRFASNTTQGGGSAVGGGIFNGGTLTLESTRVETNTARGGGGIYNSTSGRLTINAGTVVTTNTANDPTLPLGAGIYNRGVIVDNDTGTNVFANTPATFNGNPNNCINESGGTGCPA